MKRSEPEFRGLRIGEVRFTTASPEDAESGLLGWICCSVGGILRLDGVALRRTLDGRLVLSFPTKRDRAGRQHKLVRPLNDQARREFEHQVLGALGLEERSP